MQLAADFADTLAELNVDISRVGPSADNVQPSHGVCLVFSLAES
jgi:hypothetical protein